MSMNNVILHEKICCENYKLTQIDLKNIGRKTIFRVKLKIES